MKFALNHHYRFGDYKIAFLSGFMQATMIFVVETVNFITILTSNSMGDIVKDFMALAIISEFDDFFYGALGDDENKTFLENKDDFEDMFVVKRTTSSRADF